MRIAYLGNFIPPHSTENHIAASLECLGHEVTRLQEGDVTLTRVLEASQGAAFFLWTRTWTPAFAGEMLSGLRVMGVKSVAWHLDLYFGIEREKTIATDPFWKCDYCFTPNGDWQRELESLGVNHIHLDPAVFHAECYAGIYREGLACDVGFVGMVRGYHAEWKHRQELFAFLAKTYTSFTHVGDDHVLRGAQLNDFLASCKVVVGDSLNPGGCELYSSDRPYEIVGRGGYLIQTRLARTCENLTAHKHCDYYDAFDFEGLRKKIDFALEHDEVRGAIRKQGREHVRENHTYLNRARVVLETVCGSV